jgi:hypothetical protein
MSTAQPSKDTEGNNKCNSKINNDEYYVSDDDTVSLAKNTGMASGNFCGISLCCCCVFILASLCMISFNPRVCSSFDKSCVPDSGYTGLIMIIIMCIVCSIVSIIYNIISGIIYKNKVSNLNVTIKDKGRPCYSEDKKKVITK